MISLSLSTVPPSLAEALCGGGGHLGTYLPITAQVLNDKPVLKHQHAAEPPGGPVTAEGGNHTQGS